MKIIFFIHLIILKLSFSIKQNFAKKFATYIYKIDKLNQTTADLIINNTLKLNIDLLYLSVNLNKINANATYSALIYSNLYLLINSFLKRNLSIPQIGFIILEDPNFTLASNHNKSIENFSSLNKFTLPILSYINQTNLPILIDTEYWTTPNFNTTENGADNSTLSNQFFRLLKRIHKEVKPVYPTFEIEVYHSIYTRSFMSANKTNEDIEILKSYTYVLANRWMDIISQKLEFYTTNSYKYVIDIEHKSVENSNKKDVFSIINNYAGSTFEKSKGVYVFNLFSY